MNSKLTIAIVSILIISGCSEDVGAKLIKEREAKRAKAAARFSNILKKFSSLQLQSLKTVKNFKDTKRPALMLNSKRQLSMDHINIEDKKGRFYAKSEKEVGLVIIPILRRSKTPDIQYEGGGKGYHTTAYLFAIAYPEMVIVSSCKKVFKAPNVTYGITTTIAGSSVTSSSNQYGIVSPKFYRWFLLHLHGLTKKNAKKDSSTVEKTDAARSPR